MSRKPAKGDKDKGKGKAEKQVQQKNKFIYQKVSLSDGLPKVPAQIQIQRLKGIYYDSQATKEKYFPLQKQVKYQSNFSLFDRNDDKLLDYEQLKQFLISIGQMISQQDLRQFYKVLLQTEQKQDGHIEEGITLDSKPFFICNQDIYLIVLKKLQQEDVEQQLTQSFRIVDLKNQSFLQSQQFKQLLMTMGFKWGEEEADEFIKQFQPKSEKKIYWAEVVKKLIKR